MGKIVAFAVVFCLLLASCAPASEVPPVAYEPDEYVEYEEAIELPPPEIPLPEEPAVEEYEPAVEEGVEYEPPPVLAPPQGESPPDSSLAAPEGESPPDTLPQGESPPDSPIQGDSPTDPPIPWYAPPEVDWHDRWGPPLTAEEVAERLRTTTAMPYDEQPRQVIYALHWPAAGIDWSVTITDPADIAQIVQILRGLQPIRMSVPLVGGIPPTITLVYYGHTKEYGFSGWTCDDTTEPGRVLIFYSNSEYSVDARILQILDRYDPTR